MAVKLTSLTQTHIIFQLISRWDSTCCQKYGEAIKSKWFKCPFPNGVPNEAFLTSGECYSPTIIPILFIRNGTSIFISHLLRNLDKAIAALPLGPHIVRNYTFNLPLHSHTVACLFCDDQQRQLKIQWILEDRLWLLWLAS